jgi:hypothetical protein
MLIASSALAQTESVVRLPSSKPATTQVANPLRALVLHAMAMANGDPKTVRAFYLTKNASEEAVADGYRDVAGAIFRLRESANKKWGEKGFEQIGFGQMFDDEIARLNKLTYDIQGSRAIVRAPDATRPAMVLVLDKGAWKIAVGESFAKNPQRRAARINAQAKAYDELAREISRDRYATTAEAKEAGRVKVAAAMKAVAASQPTD